VCGRDRVGIVFVEGFQVFIREVSPPVDLVRQDHRCTQRRRRSDRESSRGRFLSAAACSLKRPHLDGRDDVFGCPQTVVRDVVRQTREVDNHGVVSIINVLIEELLES